MAYQIEPHRPMADEIKRVLREEMQAAAEQLRNARGPEGDQAVHEARKSVKKIRAVLRLVRTQLGAVYQRENTRFGELGRKLSELRDAGAMDETVNELRRHYGEEVDRSDWEALRRLLKARRQRTEEAVDTQQLLETLPGELEKVANEVENWPLEGDDFGVIASGLKKAYSLGRDAMEIAEERPTPERFHQWRKRVKDHWYHVRLLQDIWSPMMGAYGDVLKNIQMALGDDHNVAVLEEMMQAEGEHGRDKVKLKSLLTVMERHQTRLRQEALTAGARVYAAKPKQVVRVIRFLWNAPGLAEQGGAIN